ncbi:uncharacterized protein VICG_00968, partial [Vittaforma corneae ATCC 50505]
VETVDCPFEIKHSKSKQIEFEPEYSLLSTSNTANNHVHSENASGVCFDMGKLRAELPVLDQHDAVSISFDQSDFEAARSLCKLVYVSDNKELIKEAVRFSEMLRNLVEGKYGKEALKYIERLVPTFYCKPD